MRRGYAFYGGDLSGWPKGTVPAPGILRRLDQYSSELVNGEDGGTWSPEDPVVVGPNASPTVSLNNGSELSGDVVTVKGNGKGKDLGQPGLVLQGSGYPGFQTSRTRTVVVGFANFVEHDSAATTNVARVVLDDQLLAPRHISSLSSSRIVSVPFPVRAQHRGATISQVDLRFIVPGAGVVTALPGTMLRFRVCRITGSTLAALHSAGGVYDSNGNYVDDAATLAAFLNNGQVRTLSYVPDQNNAGLNPDADWFVIQMRSYNAGALGLTWLSATVTLTGISSFRE